MSHYRDLNKELVEQVQTMRKNMKLYCDEIVYLKGELMQKHENEVILRKQCYNWAVTSFVQLIEYVQPDSEILTVLEEHINSGGRISSISTERRPRSARISHNRRRSSLLARELQRSNSVVNLRKSVCSTSPIRRNSNETSEDDEEEQNLRTITAEAEEHQNAQITDKHSTENETLRAANIENIIYEESDEQEEEIYNCEDIDVESVYESVEDVSINISEKRTTLNNITNILTKDRNNQDKTGANKRGQPKRRRKKNFNGKENFSDEYTSREDSDIDIIKVPNEKKQTNIAQNSNKFIEEETLQEPRRCSNSRQNFDTNQSFPLNQNHGQISNNEATLNSTSLVLNDMTLRNFKDVAACSTPNSRKNSLEATQTVPCETISIAQTTSNRSIRPSRHCKPTNLTEPKLVNKLRNESEPISSRKSSRKTKSKPKTKK